MIVAENLQVKNGRKTVISGLSFVAEPGCITAVCGRNGAGKTTLLRTLIGVVKYSGSLKVCGEEVSSLKPRDRAGLISYMPQLLPAPELTACQLVLGAMTGSGGILAVPTEEQKKKALEILRQWGLKGLEDEYLCRISGGERQRAYLAMLSACSSPVVLMDEPTSSLDEESRSLVYGFMAELKAGGKTVLVVLHSDERAKKMADRILMLQPSEH